jgi:hypothetical protein
MLLVLLLPWDLFVVGPTKISHEEDTFFNQFLNPFLDKSVVSQFFGEGEILAQNMNPAIRIHQTLRDEYNLPIFFAHFEFLPYSSPLSWAEENMMHS